MKKIGIRLSIGLVALLALSSCATHNKPVMVAHGSKQCQPPNTLTCDKFADETYNCTCQKGERLRDMLDAYQLPDY